jgi:hypothetical protein
VSYLNNTYLYIAKWTLRIIQYLHYIDACNVPLTGCQHGGYQDPNDCSRCKCPDGLSGVFCDKVAPPENGK